MYNRFWEGRTNIELMTSKWAIAAMQCVAFDNYGEDAARDDKFYMGGKFLTDQDRLQFRYQILSLFSLLNATALASLMHTDSDQPLREFTEEKFEVLPGTDNQNTQDKLESGELKGLIPNRVFLVFTWVQDVLIRRKKEGGLGIPPPILSRMFQEMSNGMLGYNNCIKIVSTPFPFPYCQLINLALAFMTVSCAFVMNHLVESPWLGAFFTFISVGGYYAINETATQLEQPFGLDPNDLPLDEYQNRFNDKLRYLYRLNEDWLCYPKMDVSAVIEGMCATGGGGRCKNSVHYPYKGESGPYGDVTSMACLGDPSQRGEAEELVHDKRSYRQGHVGDQRSVSGGFRMMFRSRASVFSKTLPAALFAAGVTLTLKILGHYGHYDRGDHFKDQFSYQVYTFCLGFFLVFRCSQAYQRHWEARTEVEHMTSKWSIALLQAVVFDDASGSLAEDDKREFRQRIVPLFSLLNATAMASFTKSAAQIEVMRGLDMEAIERSLCDSSVQDQVFLVYTWVQDVLIRRASTGGLKVPPPICTRIFQELSAGMLGYNNCIKIVNTKFPFPYAQLTTLGLALFALSFGVVMDVFVENWVLATSFSFISVSGYYWINEIAIALENPFGQEHNDLPLTQFQQQFNDRVRHLIEGGSGDFKWCSAGMVPSTPTPQPANTQTQTESAPPKPPRRPPESWSWDWADIIPRHRHNIAMK